MRSSSSGDGVTQTQLQFCLGVHEQARLRMPFRIRTLLGQLAEVCVPFQFDEYGRFSAIIFHIPRYLQFV
jgi:hypothetical protein